MTANAKLIPTGSQTVGPFFSIGLDDLIHRAPVPPEPGSGWVSLHGQVLDGDGAPVPDAMLEFWSAADAASPTPPDQAEYPIGFRRSRTDAQGGFSIQIPRPHPIELGQGQVQAPHLLVLVFSRGLLRQLISRVYFADEPGNASDPLLQEMPPERRGTLIAQAENHGSNSYCWNVTLQGPGETVFFAW